jgi:hypothetical protein
VPRVTVKWPLISAAPARFSQLGREGHDLLRHARRYSNQRGDHDESPGIQSQSCRNERKGKRGHLKQDEAPPVDTIAQRHQEDEPHRKAELGGHPQCCCQISMAGTPALATVLMPLSGSLRAFMSKTLSGH